MSWEIQPEMRRVLIPISRELLRDCPPFRARTWTEAEWQERIEQLRIRRRAMDSVGASPAEKRRQTWRIKHARAVTQFPHFGFEEIAMTKDERDDLDREDEA